MPIHAGRRPRWGWHHGSRSLSKPSSNGDKALPSAGHVNWRAWRPRCTSFHLELYEFAAVMWGRGGWLSGGKITPAYWQILCLYKTVCFCKYFMQLRFSDYKNVYLLPPGPFTACVIFKVTVTIHLIRHLHIQLIQEAWWHKIITLAYKASHV